MRASRGMGCINPAKMPSKGVVKKRRDNTDFTEYAEGGEAKSKKEDRLENMRQGMRQGMKAAGSAMSPLGLPLDAAYAVYKKVTGKSPLEDFKRQLDEVNSADVTQVPKGSEVKFAKGGKSKINEAGNYTKPKMRKALFNQIKGQATQGTAAGQWSARKSQLLAKQYKARGGGYRD